MSIIYTMVSRGTTILCECTNSGRTGNFSILSRKILKKIHKTKNTAKKITYVFEGHTFNFMRVQQLFFMCMADEPYGRNMPFVFLKDVSDQFFQLYPQLAKSVDAAADGAQGGEVNMDDLTVSKLERQIQSDFTREIADRMLKYSSTDDFDTLSKIQRGISDVQTVMKKNIEKVMDRGTNIHQLVSKSDGLTLSADTFRSKARKLKVQFCRANLKFQLAIAFFVLLLLYLMGASACGWSLSC